MKTKIRKSGRKPGLFAILGFALAVPLSFILISVIHTFSGIRHGCQSEQRIVSHNSRGDVVEMREEVCGGFAYSATITLSLIINHDARKEFVSYAVNASEPVIHWNSDNVLVVNIGKTGEIYKKADHVDDIKIEYP